MLLSIIYVKKRRVYKESINDKLDCILKALSDFKQISILQEQNKSLKKSLEDLEFKHSSLMCIATELLLLSILIYMYYIARS